MYTLVTVVRTFSGAICCARISVVSRADIRDELPLVRVWSMYLRYQFPCTITKIGLSSEFVSCRARTSSSIAPWKLVDSVDIGVVSREVRVGNKIFTVPSRLAILRLRLFRMYLHIHRLVSNGNFNIPLLNTNLAPDAMPRRDHVRPSLIA